MGGSQRAVWGDLGLECESPEPPRVEVDDAVLAPYAFLREHHYKVADGANTVSIDFSRGEPRTEEGHIPEGLRVNWAGFVMELGMGRTFWEDLHPTLVVQWIRLEGRYAIFQLVEGDESQVYRCDLALDLPQEDEGILEDLQRARTYWWYDFFPGGSITGIRTAFPNEDPYDHELTIYTP